MAENRVAKYLKAGVVTFLCSWMKILVTFVSLSSRKMPVTFMAIGYGAMKNLVIVVAEVIDQAKLDNRTGDAAMDTMAAWALAKTIRLFLSSSITNQK